MFRKADGKIILKSRREIELMRATGFHAHRILRAMADVVTPGIATRDVHAVCSIELASIGAIGLSKNYPTYRPGDGYPAECCISVNEEVVHGIPGKRRLQEGDVVTLDLAMQLGEYCADTAITVGVGHLDGPRQKLLDYTRKTLDLAIREIRPGLRWSDIAAKMQRMAEEQGYGVVQEFVGHGIGRTMHEDPKVPNFTNAEQRKGDFIIRKGMTFAVEPMLVIGKRKVKTLRDGWTVVTKSGNPACHFEHTVAITDDGCDVLTDGSKPALDV